MNSDFCFYLNPFYRNSEAQSNLRGSDSAQQWKGLTKEIYLRPTYIVVICYFAPPPPYIVTPDGRGGRSVA